MALLYGVRLRDAAKPGAVRHMLFLDGVYVDAGRSSAAQFRWVKAPRSGELTQLAHTIAQRVGSAIGGNGHLP